MTLHRYQVNLDHGNVAGKHEHKTNHSRSKKALQTENTSIQLPPVSASRPLTHSKAVGGRVTSTPSRSTVSLSNAS